MAAKSRECSGCGAGIEAANKSGLCVLCLHGQKPVAVNVTPELTPEQQVQDDREKTKLRTELADYKDKYKAALAQIEAQDAQLGWIAALREGIDTTFRVEPREGIGTSEVTPIVIASDWHNEEHVRPAQVNGLNEFTLDIFDKRVTKFWQGTLRLIRMFNQDVKITTVVLALLGDFITGQIHEAENAENNQLLPVEAIINAQNKIIGGIDFLLNHSSYEFIIVCKVGNHSRVTKRVRSASEHGHSLESLLYTNLAAYYRNEKRITFVIDNGYHTYVDVYDKVCRFHHGHAIQYQGGIGGLYIPARKAIKEWNEGRKADRDFFGHFHQHLDDSRFTCNGSLIGYNAFSIRIKAPYEVPSQSLVLVDKRRGFTGKWPIFLE